MLRNIGNDADGGEDDDEGGAAVGDEQERLAGQRDDAEHSAYVHERFDDDKDGDTENSQACEIVGSADGDFKRARGEQDEECDQDDCADKTKLFGFDGKNGISCRFRKIAEFLDALAITSAENSAGADGDERLLNLITRTARVGGGI